MISVQKAVKSALDYFDSMYKGKYTALLLEEIELTGNNKYWLITMSYILVDPEVLGGLKPTKNYKIFKIEALAGRVISMKIRDL